jgi:UPF0755 protein
MAKKILIIFMVTIGSLLFIGYNYWIFLCGPVTNHDAAYAVKIEVPAGMTIKQVASVLKKNKLIHNETVFYLAARYPFLEKSQFSGLHPNGFQLKSGVYKVSSALSIGEIFDLLSSGKQEYLKIVFPEGLSLSGIAARLSTQGVCSAEEFMTAAHSQRLLDKYHIPENSFEGYLFPDTYFFTPKMGGDAVVTTMASNFFKRIEDIPVLRNTDAQKLNNVVILASIVEREYRVDSEAPLIASVFTNRLSKNIGLYSCATIVYILTEIEGKPHPEVITYDDLQIDSPYNTYKWAGLTPGPISNPGMVALKAAAAPPHTDYYFFRLTDPKTGTHSFSKDFETHITQGQKVYTKSAAGI